jgi:predicted DNA-binding protein
MSRDQAVEWFANASDDELADVVRTARRPVGRVVPASSDAAAIPLMLTSIRLPVDLVAQLDEVAAAEGINRSDAIRTAIAGYVRERHGVVSAAEAEHALEVLRRVVGEHIRDQAA